MECAIACIYKVNVAVIDNSLQTVSYMQKLSKMNVPLCIDDLNEVVQSLKGQVTDKWMSIGIGLGLSKTDLDKIEQSYNSLDRRLQEMLTLWLKQSYDTGKYGPPIWDSLIKAVGSPTGGGFPSLAAEIAADKQPQARYNKNCHHINLKN